MPQKTIQTNEKTTSSDTHQTQDYAAPSNTNPHNKHYPHTTGEKIFNAITYYAIGWIANAGISVVVTDYVRNKKGAPVFDELAERFKDSWAFRQGKPKSDQEKQQGEKAFSTLKDALKTKAAGNQIFAKNNPEHVENYSKSLADLFDKFEEDIKSKSRTNLTQIIKEHVPEAAKEKGYIDKLTMGLETALSKKKAVSQITLAALCTGGFIFMFPIKWLEDKKEKIISKTDAALGQKNKTYEEQKLIEARHKQVANEPDQSWSSIFAGRLAGVATVIGINYAFAQQKNPLSHIGIPFKGNDYYFHKWGKAIAGVFRNENNPKMKKMSDGWLEKFDKTNEKLVKAKGEQYMLDSETRFARLAEFSVADIGYSFIAATTMYISTRIIGAFFGNPRHESEPEPTQQQTANTSTTTADTAEISSVSTKSVITDDKPNATNFSVNGHTVNSPDTTPVSKVSAVSHLGNTQEHKKQTHHKEAQHTHTSKREHEKSISYAEMAKQTKHHTAELNHN